MPGNGVYGRHLATAVRTTGASILTLAVLLSSTTLAWATTITYEAIELPGSVPGFSFWQFNYQVSGTTFVADSGFDIFFDYEQYQLLEDPPPLPGPEWDAIVLQPDPLIPDDGIYDAIALVDDASLDIIFSVVAIYLDTGIPGPQEFEIFDPDFNVIDSGTTVPIPEPSMALTIGLGLFILGVRTRAQGPC